jgi:DNA polymerase-3 subunit alpha
MVGYLCAYLRYYYPYEFLTAFLNCSKSEDDIANGTELAKTLNIKIRPPRFRHSKAQYFMDKENKSIYKGLSSIKYMNSAVPEQLYNFRDRKYNSFSELLMDIKNETNMDARQLSILIRLDFFSEFGNARELMAINAWFQYFKCGDIRTIKKDKIKDENLYKIIARYSKETASSFKIIDAKSIIEETEMMQRSYEIKDFNLKEKINDQIEFYGYIDVISESNDIEQRKKLVVLGIKKLVAKTGKNAGKPWCYSITTQSIGSGKKGSFSILANLFDKRPVSEHDIIKVEDYYSRDYNGKKYWYLRNYDYIFE